MKNKRNIIMIVAIVMAVVLGCSCIYLVKDNKYKTWLYNDLQNKIDDDFIAILNQVVIEWDEEEMTDEDIYASYMQDAIACENALAIMGETSYAKYEDLMFSLNYFSSYLQTLIYDKEKLSAENADKLCDNYFEMLVVLSNESNSEKDVINSIDAFYQTIYPLYNEE